MSWNKPASLDTKAFLVILVGCSLGPQFCHSHHIVLIWSTHLDRAEMESQSSYWGWCSWRTTLRWFTKSPKCPTSGCFFSNYCLTAGLLWKLRWFTAVILPVQPGEGCRKRTGEWFILTMCILITSSRTLFPNKATF